MTTKILIMGLPGAGKTYLANELQQELHDKGFTVEWFNADEVRERYNDWDFSEEGRIRQGKRMRSLAEKSTADFVISDFVAPLPAMRDAYSADVTIWLDTIDEGRYADTNKVFVPPEKYDYRIMAKSAKRWASTIANNGRKVVGDQSQRQ
jgi:adenylylsulfate kinase